MTPEEKAWVEKFWWNTQGDYDQRRTHFRAIKQETPAIQRVTSMEFAQFVAVGMATEAQRAQYVSFLI